jgi:hypothetical protein
VKEIGVQSWGKFSWWRDREIGKIGNVRGVNNIRKTSLEFTVFIGKGGKLPVILQRTDSRKDAKIAKNKMDE